MRLDFEFRIQAPSLSVEMFTKRN